MKTNFVEIIRLIIPAGKEIPPHKAQVEIVVQRLEGGLWLLLRCASKGLVRHERVRLAFGPAWLARHRGKFNNELQGRVDIIVGGGRHLRNQRHTAGVSQQAVLSPRTAAIRGMD